MEQGRLRQLVAAAIDQGVCSEELLTAVDDNPDINSGRVRTIILLHTYQRRLRRTESGTTLRDMTVKLVELLSRTPPRNTCG